MKARLILIIALALTSLGSIAAVTYAALDGPEPTKTSIAVPPPEELAAAEMPLNNDNLLRRVNEERAKMGAAPLVIDNMLSESAQWKADDMVALGYWGHIKPGEEGANGLLFLEHDLGASRKCSYVGENLAYNKDMSELSTDDAVNGWLGSESHYKAMIDPTFLYTGFGTKAHVAVQHFCRPL